PRAADTARPDHSRAPPPSTSSGRPGAAAARTWRTSTRPQVVAETPGDTGHERHERVRPAAPVLGVVLAADGLVHHEHPGRADRFGGGPERLPVHERGPGETVARVQRPARPALAAPVPGPAA